MKSETWRDIPEYETYYQASSLGRVRRLPRPPTEGDRRRGRPGRQGGVLSPRSIGRSGYTFVTLCKNGIPRNFRTHRLVLMAFYGQPPDKYECHHKNGIRTDNRLENLEWLTRSQNAICSVKVLENIRNVRKCAHGESCSSAKLTEEKVLEIRRVYGAGHLRQWQLAAAYSVSPSTISDIVNRVTWTHI